MIPLGQRYRLLSPVGQGGMGIVWRAYDEMLDRDVAIKEVRLSERLGTDEHRLVYRRLVDEARATAALHHPGVAALYDVLVEDGRPWLVMEYLDARSLRQLVDEEGPLPTARAAEVGLAVLSVLRAAHGAGILHRDVKPSNVLLCSDGRVLLTDFGLAVHAQNGQNVTDTLPPGIEGSPAYLPPERVRGEPGTEASDMWSLGATLYTAIEGTSPFLRAHAIASMLAVLLHEYEPPARAGVLKPMIDGLLQPDPADRLDADTTERLLRAAVELQEQTAHGPAIWRWPRVGALGSTAVFVVGVVAAGAWSARWDAVGKSDAAALVAGSSPRTVAYHEPAGYTVEVPAGWRHARRRDGAVEWADPASGLRLRIAPAGQQAGDALAGLRRAEQRAGRHYPGYRRLRLETAPDIAGGAAEWEFVWHPGGNAGGGTAEDAAGLHALRSRAAGYDFTFTAPDSRWTPGQRVYDRILRSFRPDRER
ncbi:Serine/threonine-protein kinase PknD [Actinomadura sp. RB68]|uniref:non-specific serine/threonine protein kinase n=1 Tax=Actinomadura macrotermitis TaxID=2585200 RepID=A0A7K0BYD6_9ACTN|nr:Serine/threonine-protein kinase PknD [Actinomadura macrotermitis]